MTEYEKALSGELFNPADKSLLWIMLKNEILMRAFNRCPLWLQRKRERIIKKWFGSIKGKPYNIISPLITVYGKNIHDGFKVFPTLIEKSIASHHSVESCCVVGEKDDNHSQGKNPVAFIQLKNGFGDDSIREIEKKCCEELPKYELPVKYLVIDKIPVTSIGKVDYVKLEKSLIK